jgi:thioredoxin reductase
MVGYSDVAIVGAGPYGLSIATHLRAYGIPFRIFGSPMHTWREQMPDGMLLKSDGFASNLFDPAESFTLEHFCERIRTPYDHMRLPVRLETFRAYGLAFQQQLVPELEDTQVTSVERDGGMFRLQLANGGNAIARNVVLAVGISHFEYVPPVLAGLPAQYMTHSSAHKDLSRFSGRDVTVVGGGASAVDVAVLLHESGAKVTFIGRKQALKFHDPPVEKRSWWEAIRYPSSPIGPGWRSRFYADAPGLFRRLPLATRLRINRGQHPSPAGWPMKERFQGKVTARLGYQIREARIESDRVHLVLTGNADTVHVTDHVIAATGYRTDLRRFTFLSPALLSDIRMVEHTPVLSSTFVSSVPGLYFVGAASVNSFGPMMRFACGAGWTARRIAKDFVRQRLRADRPSSQTVSGREERRTATAPLSPGF